MKSITNVVISLATSISGASKGFWRHSDAEDTWPLGGHLNLDAAASARCGSTIKADLIRRRCFSFVRSRLSNMGRTAIERS